MRICLVVHGFPPIERTGVENYTQGLCRALARAGHRVEVFVPRRDARLPHLALRREEHGGYAVNWLTDNHELANPREALLVPHVRAAFETFLERERPEVVHFQHLIKLGIGLVEAARARGLPTVYTAHDYYPICHRYTLLRPDLSRCDVRNDSRACARCDLALSHLNAMPGLGDYQAGVLADQIGAEGWRTLQAILREDLEAAQIQPEVLEGLASQRAELDGLRAAAYAGIDLVLAPSRFLLDELVRGGFARERIEYQPYGFEVSDLARLPRIRSEAERPVRFAFLGSLAKHKGVHVLLEAFAALQGRAELAIWGGSSDREFVTRLRRRSSEVGALWRGPYERADLPGILGETDAVVVPSIWVENLPLVIHEAFAAGRPVVTTRLGALAECVHDGVDGLLYEPEGSADLARVLQRCVDEPELLPSLARGIRPVRDMETEARELVGRYSRLLEGRRQSTVVKALPESLRTSLARFEELSALPSRELFVRVLGGLDVLREAWQVDIGRAGAMELLALGLGESSEAQDRLREAHNEITWLRSKKDELDDGREELMTLFEDLDRLLGDARAGRSAEAVGKAIRQKELEVAEAHAQLSALESLIADKDRYIKKVEGEVLERDRHLQEVVGHLEEAGRYIRHKEREYEQVEDALGKTAAHVRQKESELREAREQEVRRAQRTTSVAQTGLAALRAQARLLRRELEPLLESLHSVYGRGKLELPGEEASFPDLLMVVRQVQEGLANLAEELEWRRAQEPELTWRRTLMREFLELRERRSVRLALALSSLGRELEKWTPGEEPRP